MNYSEFLLSLRAHIKGISSAYPVALDVEQHLLDLCDEIDEALGLPIDVSQI